jgi:F0F1-type ATP synthase assembly protein I
MKRKNLVLILTASAVVLALTSIGSFILAMVEQTPSLLIFGLVIAAAAVVLFVVNEIAVVKAEEKQIEEFFSRSNPDNIRIE